MVWVTTASGVKEDCEKISEASILEMPVQGQRSRGFYVIATTVALLMGALVMLCLLRMSPIDQAKSETKKQTFVPPEVFICPDKPYSPVRAVLEAKRQDVDHEERQKRDEQQVRRIFRPLSQPPRHGFNYEQEPALFHDNGARCNWVDLAQKRLAGLDEQSYDFQILELINCTSPSDCRAICMRMHKPNDPNVCNYVIMNRVRQIALFYNIDPLVNWNLLNDPTSDSFFWKCNSIDCDWYWRRGQKLNGLKLSDRDDHLVLKTQCRDFAACQRICETHPRCNYIVMPKNRAIGGPSYLYSFPNQMFNQSNYAIDEDRYSFELVCRAPTPAGFIPQTHAPEAPQAAPVAHQQPQNSQALPQGQQIPQQVNTAAASPIGAGFQVGAAPGTNGQLPPLNPGQGALLAANPNPNPSPSIPRDQLPPAPIVPQLPADVEPLNPRSIPQKRSRRFACLDPNNCPPGSMLMESCAVSGNPMECQDVAHHVPSIGSQHRCLHISLVNEFFQYQYDKVTFRASLATVKGAEKRSGFWVSLVQHEPVNTQRDIFVESQQNPSEYELDQESASGQHFKVSITSASEEGQKVFFGLSMKSISDDVASSTTAAMIYYAGIVAAVSFLALAAYALFNFAKNQ